MYRPKFHCELDPRVRLESVKEVLLGILEIYTLMTKDYESGLFLLSCLCRKYSSERWVEMKSIFRNETGRKGGERKYYMYKSH